MRLAISLLVLCIAPLRVRPLPPCTSARIAAVAGLTGRVVTPAGLSLRGVQLRLTPLNGDAGAARGATSDSGGRFAWAGLSGGSYRLTARRVGFTPVSVQFDLADGVTRTLTIQMTPARLLDTVRTKTTAISPERYGRDSRMDDFYANMHRGLGKFFTREKLDSLPTVNVSDALASVPGMSLQFGSGSGGGSRVFVKARLCKGYDLTASDTSWGSVALFIDGVRVPGDEAPVAFAQLHTSDIEAMAVYRDFSEVPPEWADRKICAVVAVWTRFGTDEKKPR